MKQFSYRPYPVRKVYIPKGNGKMRGLGIPSFEDKMVQGVFKEILEAIYETKFLDCSFGFRPGRSCHDAIQRINKHIMADKVNYIIDADIKGFFDNIDHDWMIRFLEHDIADKNFIRYIKRFLIGGVMEDGKKLETDKGTVQGGLISPILANVYLHYVLDLWVEHMKKQFRGEIHLVKYADDFVCMFQYEKEAQAFYKLLNERLRKFNLEIAIPATIKRLNRKMIGHYRYYGIYGNSIGLWKFYKYVVRQFYFTKRRRDQSSWLTWKKLNRILNIHPIMRPKIYLTSA